jgi:hypothetical protein
LGKSYGIKPNTIGNTLGSWKLDENTLETRGKKIPLPCPLKKEKTRWFIDALMHAEPSH